MSQKVKAGSDEKIIAVQDVLSGRKSLCQTAEEMNVSLASVQKSLVTIPGLTLSWTVYSRTLTIWTSTALPSEAWKPAREWKQQRLLMKAP